MLLYRWLEPLYLYSRLLAFGQFIMWVSFIASFLILSRHLLPGHDNLFVLAVVFIVMGWMFLPWCYYNIHHSSFSKKNSWTGSWITRHRVGYRLRCCACARGITKLCNLCKHRQDHAALCARNTLATIQYTEDNLVYNAPWTSEVVKYQRQSKGWGRCDLNQIFSTIGASFHAMTRSKSSHVVPSQSSWGQCAATLVSKPTMKSNFWTLVVSCASHGKVADQHGCLILCAMTSSFDTSTMSLD